MHMNIATSIWMDCVYVYMKLSCPRVQTYFDHFCWVHSILLSSFNLALRIYITFGHKDKVTPMFLPMTDGHTVWNHRVKLPLYLRWPSSAFVLFLLYFSQAFGNSSLNLIWLQVFHLYWPLCIWSLFWLWCIKESYILIAL